MKLSVKNISTSIVAIAALAVSTNPAWAASVTGNAIQTVTAAISIVNVSDLDFGTAAQGDVARTVAPGAAENGTNGSFTVSGTASTAYTITLPADGTVTMQTAGGGANRDITVGTFLSFPAAGANGMIGAGGTQLLLVGATRAALGASQQVGAYTTTYSVAVVY